MANGRGGGRGGGDFHNGQRGGGRGGGGRGGGGGASGGGRGGGGGNSRGRGRGREMVPRQMRQPQEPSEIWAGPKMPKTPPVIEPLAEPSPRLPSSNELQLEIQKPKSPGQVNCAQITCLTNCFQLSLGSNIRSAFFYTVQIEQMSKSKKAGNQKGSAKKKPASITQEPSTGPKKQRRLSLELNRSIFSKIPPSAFDNQMLAYDSKQRACGLKRLPNDSLVYQVECDDSFWQVTLTYEKAVNLAGLKPGKNFSMGEEFEESMTALMYMLNYMPSLHLTPLGRGFYGLPDEQPTVISGGFEVWSGYRAHILAAEDKLILNTNRAITAFIRPGYLVERMADLLGVARNDVPTALHRKQILELSKKLSRCKAELTHLKRPKHITIQKITLEPASKISFRDHENNPILVTDYFSKTYGCLKYPNWPCAEAGIRGTRYYPLEVLKILSGNSYHGEQSRDMVRDIIRLAAIPPRNRLEEIKFTTRSLISHKEIKDEFGMHIEPIEMTIPGRILPTPILTAGNKKIVGVNPGVIDFRDNMFFKTSKIDRWTVINTDERQTQDTLQCFARAFQNQGKKSGVLLANPVQHNNEFPTISDRQALKNIIQQIIKMVTVNKLDFIIFVISNYTGVHAAIKSTCDVTLGVSSKCVKSDTIEKIIRNDRPGPNQCLVNILYGLNPKFEGENVVGINTEFAFKMLTSTPTIIIGLDVNHGQTRVCDGLPKLPSTIGIVGTRNVNATLYTAVMSAQKKPEGTRDREIIQSANLKPAIKRLFISFYQKTGRKPQKVIIYRDGVSNGQFKSILSVELRAIIETLEEMSDDNGGKYRPAMTFVTVQKRHDVRLFPKQVTVDNKGREKQNPIPGTVVDSVLPSRRWWNFYLNSHEGIQGTSKPAHYIVLFDENNFTNDQMQSLSYYLCYLYGKCPRAVSIPAPIYYAHLVAFRAAEVGAFQLHSSPEYSPFDVRNYAGAPGIGAIQRQEQKILELYQNSIDVKQGYAQKMFFL
ncbi:protein argonaute 12-like isoform X2 [Varroa jacobsoni]|nr:protein argonaute 12-like isoform X2 [Varroa jacobsoni]